MSDITPLDLSPNELGKPGEWTEKKNMNIIQFPLKAEISGPMTMDAEDFKANLRAAYLSGEAMMKEKAAMVAETPQVDGAHWYTSGDERRAKAIAFAIRNLAPTT